MAYGYGGGYGDDVAVAALSSGYDDRDYHDDDHDKDDSHGGHSASGYGKEECCPLVVDLLCLAAILFAILGATLFLNQVNIC